MILGFVDNVQNLALGLVLPIVIMVIQLILRWRDKQVSHITIVENKCSMVFPSLMENIDGLTVEYDKKPIEGNLIFFQITIFNSGVSDIPDTSIYEPLCLKLPSGFKWKSYKIFDNSENLKFEITLNEKDLSLIWDLLKIQEYIRIDTVIEYSPNSEEECEAQISPDNLLSNISFNKTRVLDLKVSKSNIRNYDILLRNLKTCVFFVLTMLFLYEILLMNERIIVFDAEIPNIQSPVSFSIKGKNNVIMTDSLGNEFIYEQHETFLINNVSTKKNVEKKSQKSRLIPIFVLVNVWGFILFEQFRMRKKRERLGLVSSKSWNQFEIEDC